MQPGTSWDEEVSELLLFRIVSTHGFPVQALPCSSWTCLSAGTSMPSSRA